MSNIQITTINETLVVDSRLVAEELGIKHKTFLETIRKYLSEFEEMGVMTFETAKPLEGSQGGRPETFCYLNEDQATYAMTLSRNTDTVRQCKRNLVKAFSEAKKLIKSNQPELSPAEAILQMAQFMVEQERKTKEIEAKLALESQRNDQIEELVKQHDAELERIHKPCGDYFTVMGYARLKGINGISLNMANSLGRKASKACRDQGLPIEQVKDPRFGMIGCYPEKILESLI